MYIEKGCLLQWLMGCGPANPLTMTGYKWEVQEYTGSSILETGYHIWSSVCSTHWNPEEADFDASDGMHLLAR